MGALLHCWEYQAMPGTVWLVSMGPLGIGHLSQIRHHLVSLGTIGSVMESFD